MTIPNQLLQLRDVRYIKVANRQKIPLEKKWTTEKNYPLEDIKDWIKKGNNYGVCTGIGNLLVLDADNPALIEAFRRMPPTFAVRTKKGIHLYYLCYDNVDDLNFVEVEDER